MSLPAYQSKDQAYEAGMAALAPYLDGSSLNSLSRVNSTFFKVFGSYLWKDPIKIIYKSRTPYTKAIKFISQKHGERFSDVVQILDFRPLIRLKDNGYLIHDFIPNERYFNCHYILNILTYFKNLKFVVLDDIQNSRNAYFYDETYTRYNIKPLLLSVSSSVLLDMSAVLEADMFSNLMYLDISATYHAPAAIASLSNYEFGNLRIVKMSNMRLTKLPRFVLALGLRLWSLDVSENLLTDIDIDALILHCIKPAISRPDSLTPQVTDAAFFDHPPEYTLHGDVQDDIPARRPDSTTPFIEAMLNTDDDVSNPMYANTGLTQLYISSNRLTSVGTRLLLRTTNRLQVLDLGAMQSDVHPTMIHAEHATIFHTNGPNLMPPSHLERIRIHHSFVTYVPTLTLGSSTHYHEAYIQQAEIFAQGYTSDPNISYDPLQNHRITHLILTHIPTKSYGILIDHLIALIRKVTKQHQDIETVRAAATRHRRSPVLLPGLRLLRLEFIHDDGRGEMSSSYSSVSGDRDADTFLERSLGDFSFFGEGEGGDGGLAAGKMKKEKDKKVKGRGKEKEKEKVLRDVVAELKTFREKEQPRWSGQLQLVVPARGL
ncbi:hypothetical protein ONS95_000293 [Cadophora gregata]|uniref:uncharacterized protein n=1 Tax=Cadophora gregata TaxID=51156 RepID=UPI0026DC48C2|nr:uncharacterized protein ONS95_000293 [Cadophora gregata]KAK0128318.1 hypothetical protein ONS95_000293 [Cadophora gregata]